ncbi:hypothetical protein JK164_08660 [Gluconobacter kondonii]|nr:hypothetical protein [Gluconobacter kondonii]
MAKNQKLLAKAYQQTVFRSLHIYVIVPEDPLWLNGVLPVDPVAGLEEGLIRTFKPKWNRRGCGAE